MARPLADGGRRSEGQSEGRTSCGRTLSEVLALIPRDRDHSIPNARLRQIDTVLRNQTVTPEELVWFEREILSARSKVDAAIAKRERFFKAVAERYILDP